MERVSAKFTQTLGLEESLVVLLLKLWEIASRCERHTGSTWGRVGENRRVIEWVWF